MRPPRRLFVVVFSLTALIAAGCGSSGANRGETPSGASTASRTVQHAMGQTEITGKPKRVVVLDTGELDSVLALGVTPVGAVRTDATAGLQSYLAERIRDVPVIGTNNDPNLEAIAALQPDLILSSRLRHEALYDKFSQIAPTVFAEQVGVTWKENFLLAGDALGMREEAERILADYEQKAKQVGQQFGDPGSLTVSMVRFYPANIRLYGEGSFIGTILRDAGFARPQSQQVDKTFVEVSPEQIAQADGDVLFYSAYGSSSKDAQDKVTANALWQHLGAVSAGRAHEVSDDLWYLGIGPIAADLVLDDMKGFAAS
ncbi:MAG TPA: iron-siderophore ABC transporter substrate-binding protein [Pseudonocardiaceae bacterium]|nr:iron-siderophore ABC transporter substrate-binding protein [Pseudonocardiaceae bacterium]